MPPCPGVDRLSDPLFVESPEEFRDHARVAVRRGIDLLDQLRGTISLVSKPVTGHRGVDRENQGFIAGRPGTCDAPLRYLAPSDQIELEPARPAGDLLDA